MNVGKLLAKVALFGVAGWTMENVLFGERYSAAFPGAKVPFLPIYAFGGAAVTLMAPHLQMPAVARAAVYGATLSGIELAGCAIERDAGACNWDYSGQRCAKPLQGCVDLPHAAMWGALGLLVEALP